MRPWKRLNSSMLITDRWMRLRADRCELPSGLILDPYYVVEEPDWVHIVATSTDDRVLTVRQFRYAAGVTCTELPGGAVDPGEDPLDAAKRELREETGFDAAVWREVGSMFANPARQTNRLHVFVATELTAGPQALEPSEEIEFGFLTRSELKAAIRSGAFSQSLHIASLSLALDFV